MTRRNGFGRLVAAVTAVGLSACSAGEAPSDDLVPETTGTAGGDASPDDVPSGGTGGTSSTSTEEEITHPLFGAGNATSTLDLSDPCIAAQVWEASTNMDLSTGALVLKDGVVFEVTGEGEGTSVWADEWTEPPCSSDTNGHCAKLLYEEVATCDE